ncbi:hypothetical protein BDP55DRAFT_721269, partial [Colletotrichum godetiae]
MQGIHALTSDLYEEALRLKTKSKQRRKDKSRKQIITQGSVRTPWKVGRQTVKIKSQNLLQKIEQLPKPWIESHCKELEAALTSAKLIGPISQFYGAVVTGVSLLSQMDPDLQWGSFGRIAACRDLQTRGQAIQDVLEQSELAVHETANSLVWVSKMLASSTRIIRRKLDTTYTETGSLDEENQVRRRDRGAETIHQVVNQMYPEQRGNAFLVYRALEMQGAEASASARVAKEHISAFVPSVVTRLNSEDWASVHDTVRIFHCPAVLSWALCLRFASLSCFAVSYAKVTSYEETCKHLGLNNFAHSDPGIATHLDGIAERFIKLNKESPTLPREQILAEKMALETEADAVMRVPLGRLRTICTVEEQVTRSSSANYCTRQKPDEMATQEGDPFASCFSLSGGDAERWFDDAVENATVAG